MVNARDVILETVCVCVWVNLSCVYTFVLLACTWVMLMAGFEGAGCQVMKNLQRNYKAGGWGQPPGPQDGLGPRARNGILQFRRKEMNSVNTADELGSKFCTSQTSGCEHTLPNTLSAGFWDHEWRTQPSCDQTPNSEKLWYTKCALVKATQFVLIYNTAREK